MTGPVPPPGWAERARWSARSTLEADLTGLPADLVTGLPDLVGWALAAGAERVQAWADPSEEAVLIACLPAGLRREGVARHPGGDRLLLGRCRDDVDPARDGLPTISTSFDRVIRAAGWLIRDPAGRVLMLQTTYKPAWDVPGGIVEAKEDLPTAARREIAEELGVDLPLGRLLVLDYCLDDGRRYDIELAVFDGGVHGADLTERARFLDGEIAAAHWVQPDRLDQVAAGGTVRRIRAGLQVLAATGPGAHQPLLLREGRPIACYDPTGT